MGSEIPKNESEVQYTNSQELCGLSLNNAVATLENQCQQFQGADEQGAQVLQNMQKGEYIYVDNEKGEVERRYLKKTQKDLKECSRDNAEDCLSIIINKELLSITSVSKLKEVGEKMSKKTKEGIQAIIGAGVDGKFGPGTLRKLGEYKVCSVIDGYNRSVRSVNDLKLLFKGRDVFSLQRILKQEGTYKGAIDGKIGNGTFSAYQDTFGNGMSKENSKSIEKNLGMDDLAVIEKVDKFTEDSVMKKLENSRGSINNSKELGELLNRNELIIIQTIAKRKGFYKGRIDGKTGPNSFESYENLLGIVHPNREMKNEADYRKRYAPLGHALEGNLNLDKGIVNAIVKKETTYGTDLNSRTGSKGMMQLTNSPFDDMEGKASAKNSKGVWVKAPDFLPKVLVYKALFEKLNLDSLKNTPNGIIDVETQKEGIVKDTMPQEIWDKLEKVQTLNITEYSTDKANRDATARETAKIFAEFRKLLKNPNDKHTYIHTLNMIVGSVYFKKLLNTAGGNLQEAAVNYNGDNNNGHKYVYGRIVMQNFKEEQERSK